MPLLHPPATSHGKIEQLFEDIFFVQGSVIMGPDIQISRNMIIVRENDELTLISAVRLNEDGLAQLNKLGKVANIVRLGDYHLGHLNGIDDAFYMDTYRAKLWLLPGMKAKSSNANICYLKNDQLPISNASLFVYESSAMPEALLLVNKDDGVLISADSFQNWLEADPFFSTKASSMMAKGGFIKPANIGPEWRRVNKPLKRDFDKALNLPFNHLLPSHGAPILQQAKELLQQTITETFYSDDIKETK